MNREEAKEFLIAISYKLGNMSIEYLTEKDGEKMREAIKALEQQTCEDAVNRAHVMLIVREFLNNSTYDEKMLVNDLNKLHSVQPELKPCEDAVSREAVLMELGKYLCGVPFDEKGIDEVIKELPPVKPQPKTKTGYWKKMVEVYDLQQNRMLVPYGYDDAKFGNAPVYVCDCGCESNKNSRFCPDCGARMVEPQEKQCANCNHYGKLSLDCARCDDDCSMFEPQESEG